MESVPRGASLCFIISENTFGLPFLPCTQLIQGEHDDSSETEQETKRI